MFSNEGNKINNCKINSESCNNYISNHTEKITYIFNNNKIDHCNTIKHMQNSSQLFKNPFPKIIFSNTSTKEIEKLINSLQSKNSYGYDEISMKS